MVSENDLKRAFGPAAGQVIENLYSQIDRLREGLAEAEKDTVRLDYWLRNSVDVERGCIAGRDVFAVVQKPLKNLITDYHHTPRAALDDAISRIPKRRMT